MSNGDYHKSFKDNDSYLRKRNRDDYYRGGGYKNERYSSKGKYSINKVN